MLRCGLFTELLLLTNTHFAAGCCPSGTLSTRYSRCTIRGAHAHTRTRSRTAVDILSLDESLTYENINGMTMQEVTNFNRPVDVSPGA